MHDFQRCVNSASIKIEVASILFILEDQKKNILDLYTVSCFDPVVLLIAYCGGGGGVAQRFLPLLYCYYFVCT